MKKLQLLALTMLLSTPFAITYTSAATAKQDNRSDRQDARQASRNARRDELKSRESVVEGKKDAFMAADKNLQATKNDFGQTLRSQIQAVENEIKDLNLSSDQSQAGRAALLNLHQERDTLRSRLQHHKYTLQTRKSLLMGHADCIQNHIADLQAEQAQVQNAANGLAQDNPRVQYLQGRLADITAEIAARVNDFNAVQVQVAAAQASMNDLQDKKAEAKGEAIKGRINS